MPNEIKGTELKREKTKLTPEQEEKITQARVEADLIRAELLKSRQQATATMTATRAKKVEETEG